MIDEDTISRIAQDAVDKVYGIETATGSLKPRCEVSYEGKAFINKPFSPNDYYSRRFAGMSDKSKKLLAEAYLMRQEPLSDKRWIDLYLKFVKATNKRFHSDDNGLKDFKTMAVYYWEKIRNRKNNLTTKDESFYSNNISRHFTDYRNRMAGIEL